MKKKTGQFNKFDPENCIFMRCGIPFRLFNDRLGFCRKFHLKKAHFKISFNCFELIDKHSHFHVQSRKQCRRPFPKVLFIEWLGCKILLNQHHIPTFWKISDQKKIRICVEIQIIPGYHMFLIGNFTRNLSMVMLHQYFHEANSGKRWFILFFGF